MKSKTPIIGLCQLCHTTQRLRFSHIIPNQFFKRTKDHGQSLRFIIGKGRPPVKDQDTWREYLLCPDCEEHLNKYERHISQVLYYPEALGVIHTKARNKQGIKGFNPHFLKLFQLSILWRASISTRKEFSYINLPYQQNEELRQILYYERPCQPEKYWCALTYIFDEKGLLADFTHIILSPIAQTHRGQTHYLFVFGGYLWTFHIPDGRVPLKTKSFLKKGRLFIPREKFLDIPVILEAVMDLCKSTEQEVL